MIERLSILGAGLIGGSLALALKKAGFCNEVVGYARNEANLKQAVVSGVLDHYEMTVEHAVKGADVIVLATPLGAIEGMMQSIDEFAKTDAVITDVGSAKTSVVNAARKRLSKRLSYFVPGHPIAGKEHSGVAHADAELFQNHYTLLTPLAESLPASVQLIASMWKATGAVVENMTVEVHDKVLAATSHLPHMLAFLMIETLAKMEAQDEVFKYAAGGFYDFTRIASSSPAMWRDICLSNPQAIETMLRGYGAELNTLADRVAQADGTGLFELFTRAKLRRDELVA